MATTYWALKHVFFLLTQYKVLTMHGQGKQGHEGPSTPQSVERKRLRLVAKIVNEKVASPINLIIMKMHASKVNNTQ